MNSNSCKGREQPSYFPGNRVIRSSADEEPEKNENGLREITDNARKMAQNFHLDVGNKKLL